MSFMKNVLNRNKGETKYLGREGKCSMIMYFNSGVNAVSICSGLWEIMYSVLSILRSRNIIMSTTREER